MWPLDEQRLLVFAGGWVHVLDLRTGRARRTQQLRWYGRGKGRGLMAFGLARAADGTLYFAEYVTEPGDRSTGVWRSRDAGERWELAFEFEPGQVRHIHAVHCDRDGSLWIGTGDRDEHCFVGRSIDGGSTFEWVGHGAQIHRTCAFVGFDDVVLWSTDADFEQNHVVRWHRATGEVTVDARAARRHLLRHAGRRRARAAGPRAGGRAGVGRAPRRERRAVARLAGHRLCRPGAARRPACGSRAGQPRRGVRAREPASDDRPRGGDLPVRASGRCPGERGRRARAAGGRVDARARSRATRGSTSSRACSRWRARASPPCVVASSLARSEYGAYAIVVGINVVLVMGLDLGLTSSVARFVAQGRASTRLVVAVALLRLAIIAVAALLILAGPFDGDGSAVAT